MRVWLRLLSRQPQSIRSSRTQLLAGTQDGSGNPGWLYPAVVGTQAPPLKPLENRPEPWVKADCPRKVGTSLDIGATSARRRMAAPAARRSESCRFSLLRPYFWAVRVGVRLAGLGPGPAVG